MKQLPFFLIPLAMLGSSCGARAEVGRTSNWGLGDAAYASNEYSMRDYAMLSPWRDQALWNQPQNASKSVSQHDFTQALAQQIPVLGMVKSWRDTFRGQGASSRREWNFGGDSANATVLSLGTQSLPQYQFLGLNGNVVGAGLKIGRFSFGSSAMSSMLQNFADTYDNATEGSKKSGARDATNYTWMTAQAMNNSRGTLDLVMMRVNRDMTPGQSDNKKMIGGTSMGARADLKLWADWKMRGEWMANRREKGESANAWHLEMNGPLRNPLGLAQINFWMDTRQPGFAGLNDFNSSTGYSNMRLMMQQNVRFGTMQTALQWSQNQNENLALQIGNGGEIASGSSEAKADMSWKMSPFVFISANYLNFQSDRQTANGMAPKDDSTNREEARANVNWQISPEVSTTLNLSSQKAEQSTTADAIVYSNASSHQESRADVNWKVSPDISATAGVTAVSNDLKNLGAGNLNLNNLDSQESRANLNWKVSPDVSLVAKVVSAESTQNVGISVDALNATLTHRQEVGGGVQWQLSRGLAISATTAQVSTDRDLLAFNAKSSQPRSRQNDQQLALGLTHRTQSGNWNLQLTQHDVSDEISNNTQTSGQTLQIQTERQLLPNLRIKGLWNLSSDADLSQRLANERASRSVEAQWGLSGRSNLSVNYSDWNNVQNRSNYASSLSNNQFGLRFNWGSIVSGNGLGLALEYAKADTTDPSQRERYKIGLTYK